MDLKYDWKKRSVLNEHVSETELIDLSVFLGIPGQDDCI